MAQWSKEISLAALLRGMRDTKEVVQLTEALAQEMRDSGCDPCCHVCSKKLVVNDLFGARRIANGVTGTVCAECLENEKPVPTEEVKQAEERFAEAAKAARMAQPIPVTPRRGFLVFD